MDFFSGVLWLGLSNFWWRIRSLRARQQIRRVVPSAVERPILCQNPPRTGLIKLHAAESADQLSQKKQLEAISVLQHRDCKFTDRMLPVCKYNYAFSGCDLSRRKGLRFITGRLEWNSFFSFALLLAWRQSRSLR